MANPYENLDPEVQFSLLINDLEMSNDPAKKLKGSLSKAIAHQSLKWLQENSAKDGPMTMMVWLEITVNLLAPVLIHGAKPGSLPIVEKLIGDMFKTHLHSALKPEISTPEVAHDRG